MQVRPRREHRKTRTGCVQCKRRKVKCGEEGNPCKNCVKRNLACTYVHTYHCVTPQPQSPAHGEAQHAHAGLNREEELCLAYLYSTSTFMSLPASDKDLETWRNMPFYDGLKYPFVLDAVLALASLHKAHLQPQDSEKYASACVYYQSQCLRTYQEQLSDVNQENCHAMFVVSALMNVITIGMSSGSPNLSPTPPIETLLTIYNLLRGIQIVLRTTFDAVKSAHYGELFSIPSALPGAVVSSEVVHVMSELRQCATKSEPGNAARLQVYNASIESLEDHFKQVDLCKNIGAVVQWPIYLSEKAIELLRDRDPMMMLIFVHYGVLYLHIHQRWWARDFGSRLIWDLSEHLHALGASWLPLTSWARSKAGMSREEEALPAT